MSRTRARAWGSVLLLAAAIATAAVGPAALALAAASVAPVAGQRYKDRRVVDVLREFQRQGVRIIFSTALVRPDMRVVAEPAEGDDRQKVITAILAPHGLAPRAGPRGILMVVRATKASASSSKGCLHASA